MSWMRPSQDVVVSRSSFKPKWITHTPEHVHREDTVSRIFTNTAPRSDSSLVSQPLFLCHLTCPKSPVTLLLRGPCLSLPGLSLNTAHQLAAEGLLAVALFPPNCPLVCCQTESRDGSLSCVSGSPAFPLPTHGPLIIWAPLVFSRGTSVLTICTDPTVKLNSRGPTCPPAPTCLAQPHCCSLCPAVPSSFPNLELYLSSHSPKPLANSYSSFKTFLQYLL